VTHEVGTLAVDEWAVTFGIARRGLGGAIHPSTAQCTIHCVANYINGQVLTSYCSI